jgi:hypothetical protein
MLFNMKKNETINLMSVHDYAQTRLSRRGHPVSVQYIYRLIALNKKEGRVLDFDYVEIGKSIFIKGFDNARNNQGVNNCV